MSTLPRCPVKGCSVRYTGGIDRLCRDHSAEDELDRLVAEARKLAYGLHTGDDPDAGHESR